jgi:hypothetical protein
MHERHRPRAPTIRAQAALDLVAGGLDSAFRETSSIAGRTTGGVAKSPLGDPEELTQAPHIVLLQESS